MSDKVEITNIVFKIGEKTIELTLEESKKLQNLLNSNFGQNYLGPYPTPVIIDRYIPYYPQPYRWQEWEVTWQGMDTATDNQTGGTLCCSC